MSVDLGTRAFCKKCVVMCCGFSLLNFQLVGNFLRIRWTSPQQSATPVNRPHISGQTSPASLSRRSVDSARAVSLVVRGDSKAFCVVAATKLATAAAVVCQRPPAKTQESRTPRIPWTRHRQRVAGATRRWKSRLAASPSGISGSASESTRTTMDMNRTS